MKAAHLALEAARAEPVQIDLIIGTSATVRPRINPSAAGNGYTDISLPLQRALGAQRAACLDIGATACGGFLYGSVVAASLLTTLNLRRALVVAAENPQPILNFRYRNSVLFGAGAAAGIWERCSEQEPGLLAAVLHADATYYDAFDIDTEDKLVMHGKPVAEQGPTLLLQAAHEVLDRCALTPADLDWLLPHQGNLAMIEDVRRRLGLPPAKLLLNIDRRGNTSSAGIPGCLSEHTTVGRVLPGDLILTLAIGRGFSWGAMLLRYGRPPDRPKST